MRDDLIILEVCREYGWTYQQFMEQPHYFTELAIEKLIIDSKRAKTVRDGVQ